MFLVRVLCFARYMKEKKKNYNYKCSLVKCVYVIPAHLKQT